MERANALWVPPEIDFVLWLESQITLLRENRLPLLDARNLLSELEEMVIEHRHELASRLRVITMHLLKWEFQPSKRSSKWRKTLEVQRMKIEARLEESPSLGNQVDALAQREYRRAVRLAVLDTGLPANVFPAELPYTRDQLLDPDFVL